MSLNNLGNTYGTQGEFEVAHDFWQQSLTIWRELDDQGTLGDRRGLAATLDNLGNVASSRGQRDAAHQFYEEGLSIRRELGNLTGVAYSLLNLAGNFIALGDSSKGKSCYLESLRLCTDLGDAFGTQYSLLGLAEMTDPISAAKLWGRCLRIREDLGTPPAEGGIVRARGCRCPCPQYPWRRSDIRSRLGGRSQFDS